MQLQVSFDVVIVVVVVVLVVFFSLPAIPCEWDNYAFIRFCFI